MLLVEGYQIKAELLDGSIIVLKKDCDCITHDGPHWYYMNLLDKKAWLDFLNKSKTSPSLLHFNKDNHPEILRLKILKQIMTDLKIQRIILPFESDNYDLYVKKSYLKANPEKKSLNKCSCDRGRNPDPEKYFEICKNCNGTGFLKG